MSPPSSPFPPSTHTAPSTQAQRHAQLEARRHRARLLRLLDTPDGELVLAQLEARFETHLPAYQGKTGHYDPLDAMRRDAHREVFLVIRHQLEQARQEATQHNTTPNT